MTDGFHPNHHLDFVRDDGTSVEIAAVVQCEDYRLPCYAEDYRATLPGTSTEVTLSEKEAERLDELIAQISPLE